MFEAYDMQARWHLIAAPTGAGKSTLARSLCSAQTAVTFAIDEWMNTLFWPDCPQKNDYPWAIERVRRCEQQIVGIAIALAKQGVSSVLDLGFTLREQRMAWVERARAANVSIELHTIEVSAEIRWQRVLQRNHVTGDTFSFAVSREMFDAMELMWEPVTEQEQELFDTPLCEPGGGGGRAA